VNFLKKIAIILLAVMLALTNVRLSFGRMYCLHSGKSEIALGKAVACEETDLSKTALSETCCDILQADFIPDYSVASHILKANTVDWVYLNNLFFSILNFNFVKQTHPSFISFFYPPPLSLTTLLSLLSIYKI